MGHKPLLVAADPYRPAAVTQLQTLGKQIDVPVFHEPNKKPPELAQAAVKYAEQNGLSFVILDTAGRLQINDELMRELESITAKVSPRRDAAGRRRHDRPGSRARRRGLSRSTCRSPASS